MAFGSVVGAGGGGGRSSCRKGNVSSMEMVLDPCVLPWDAGKRFQRRSTMVWDEKGSPVRPGDQCIQYTHTRNSRSPRSHTASPKPDNA